MNDHVMSTPHASGAPRNRPATYTPDDIERIEKTISSAPVPARPLTAADALAAISQTLSRSREKGHSLASLVQLCAQQGLHVSERAVSRAITTARASKTAKKKAPPNAS